MIDFFDELFRLIAGKAVERFETFEDVRLHVLDRADAIAKAGGAIEAKWAELASFYSTHGAEMFSRAKKLGGIKMVLGGGSRLGETQLDSIRKLALYADTILVPDPVLPWLEAQRAEEKFRHVLQLQSLYYALHLRPLIDADLPYPAIILVPSWEKTLENHDAETQRRQSHLIVNVLSFHLSRRFQSLDEVFQYAAENPREFLSEVERKRLFLPPGCEAPPTSVAEAARIYRGYIRTWRRTESVARLPDEAVIMNGLIERLGPQFHLLENVEELGSTPILSLQAHWHYFDMCRTAFAGELSQAGILAADWSAAERALQDPDLRWLGNVPWNDLVRLRRDNENESFRRHLQDLTSELHNASLADVGKIAPEIVRRLQGLIAEHQKRVREVEEEFQLKYKKTAGLTLVTGVATFAPVLAPVIGVVPGVAGAIAAASMYASTKMDERAALRQLSKSLFGVLTSAAAKTD